MTQDAPATKPAKHLLIIALILFAVLIAVFVGPRIYAAIQNARAAEELQVAGDSVALASVDGAWASSSGSEAGYRVEEVLNGADVTVVGRTDEVTAQLQVSEGTLRVADVEIGLESVATDNGSRDRKFRELMRVNEFPTATFELTEPVDLKALTQSGELTTQASGELSIAGVARPAQVSVTVRNTDAGLQAAGQIPITFADFGVEAPSLGFVKVEEAGLVEFLLLLSPAS